MLIQFQGLHLPEDRGRQADRDRLQAGGQRGGQHEEEEQREGVQGREVCLQVKQLGR